MEQLLKSFPVQDVALAFFLLGVWWSDRRAGKRAELDAASRRAQGERLGEVERAQAALEAALRASRSDAG